MTSTDIKGRSKEELDERLRDALLARALWERQEREIAELEKQIEKDEELEHHVQKRRQTVMALIDREVRKKHFQSAAKKTPRIIRIVAAVLLFMNLGLTTATALVPSVRVKVMELLVNIEREYTELNLREKESYSFEIPAGWKGSYFPSRIPDEYRFFELIDQDMTGSNIVVYRNDEGNKVYFLEGKENTSVNINTEKADVSTILIHGQPGIISVGDNGYVCIAWAEAGRMFVLGFDGGRDETVKIAESVIRID